MKQDEQININNYNDFTKQLNALKEDATATVMSYFKYCWQHDSENDFNFYRELIEDELETFGLSPYLYKVTCEMNFVFRFGKKVEAILYVKAYGVDVFINKR